MEFRALFPFRNALVPPRSSRMTAMKGGFENSCTDMPKGSSISATDKKKLETHQAHHSDKHSKSMRMSMLKGSTFEDAHKKAMEFVGK